MFGRRWPGDCSNVRSWKKLLTEKQVGPWKVFEQSRPQVQRNVKLSEIQTGVRFARKVMISRLRSTPRSTKRSELCPICKKGQIYVLDRAYACENRSGKEKTCTFRISKNILHREIPKEHVARTDYDGQDRSSPEVVSKKGAFFCAPQLGKWKSRFRNSPKEAEEERAAQAAAA